MTTLDPAMQDAFVYSFPLYEMARTRYLATQFPLNVNRQPVGSLVHRRALSDHRSRQVTTPNNDTLYSSAWLDLANGPVELSVPRIVGRYWSIQFMDAYSSTEQLLGSRSDGEGGMRVWLALEGDPTPAPTGVRVLRLPTRDVWMLVRIVVDSAQDAPAVHALQDQIKLGAAPETPAQTPSQAPSSPALAHIPVPSPQSPMGSNFNGANYLAVVNAALARNPVPQNAQLLNKWGNVSVKPSYTATENIVSEISAAAWSNALPALYASLKTGVGTGAVTLQGWQMPHRAIGVYQDAQGAHYPLRAGVALSGLGALPAQEAVYLSAAVDSEGQALSGQHRYRVRIPAGGVPAQAFWSLSMYQIESDGRLFFTDNPIKRYALGDRSPDLTPNPDGTLDIAVQTSAPQSSAQLPRWLPAPQGAFRLMLRAYAPKAALLDATAALPRIERID